MKAQVEKVTWLSEVALEAEVVLFTHDASVLAFCHPCELEVGSVISVPLHAFQATEIRLHTGAKHSIESAGGLAHTVTGALTDHERQIVSSCGFLIELDDYLPGGLAAGDTISFQCGRLDIW